MKPYRIDDKGEQILQILSQDGKTTHEDIARQLSMKVADVSEIIRKGVEKILKDYTKYYHSNSMIPMIVKKIIF